MKIGNIEIKLVKGNLADQDVVGLVVPEFKSCASGGGVGGAIYRAGMGKGMDEYDDHVQTSPLKYGEVLYTDSGRSGTMLAHVATAGAKEDEQFTVVFKAVLNTLIKGYELGVRTFAIPELGTGIIGSLTQEQSARAIFSAVQKFTELKPDNDILSISLVIYGSPLEPAQKVLNTESYKTFKNEVGQKPFDMAAWLIGMGFV